MSRLENRATPPTEAQGFPTTHWSEVLAVADSQPDRAFRAMAQLCANYWYPLYVYARRRGHKPEDAQDLTQGFFARVLEKRSLDSADPEKGRFRSFLLVALKRFEANEWDRSQCQKRGGGCVIQSLDEQDAEGRYLAEVTDPFTPERTFERQWILTLLHRVLDRLEREFLERDRAALFNALKPFLEGEARRGGYAEVAARLGMTEGALQVAVHRLRQRYRELLRDEISRTLARPEEIDDEIRYLFAVLS